MKKQVVITGMGVVTPLGNKVEGFWGNLRNGVNGITTQDWLVEAGYASSVGGAVMEPVNIDELVEAKEARRMDPFTRYAIHAADQAVRQSGLDMNAEDPARVGVLIGSGVGGLHVFEEQAKNLARSHRRVSPFFIPMLIPDIAAGFVSIIWGMQGINYSISSACATASHAIGNSLRAIRYGDADVMVCGGADASLTPIGYAGFCNMKALSTNPDPNTASRPFDRERDGFVMGEGAGIFVLESREHAEARGAEILAELAGFGMTGDAHHITSPPPGHTGAVRAMHMAMADAELTPADIDYINAHGTSTPANDKNESQALRTVFGKYADTVAISSTKSMTGHLLGASGGVELAASVCAIRDGVVPPTVNYQTPDPDCDLNYTPNTAIERPLTNVLSNSFGFGGHNAVLAVRAFKG